MWKLVSYIKEKTKLGCFRTWQRAVIATYCQKCETKRSYNFFFTCTFRHSACFSSSDDTSFLCLSNISFSCSVAVLGMYTGRDRSSCRIRITDIQDSSEMWHGVVGWTVSDVSKERRGITQQHWVTSQKILILSYTAVKTSNPTIYVCFPHTCPSTQYLQHMEYMPLGLKQHTEFPNFHKTVHAQKNSVNEYTFVYSTLQSTAKVQRSTKRTFGKSARLSSGSLLTNGLHGPWIDGQSVCHIFLSLIIWFPDCVRSKFTHLTTSSREWLWQYARCLSPFTGIENKHSSGDGIGYYIYIYLHRVISNVQNKLMLIHNTKPEKWESLLNFLNSWTYRCAVH